MTYFLFGIIIRSIVMGFFLVGALYVLSDGENYLLKARRRKIFIFTSLAWLLAFLIAGYFDVDASL